MSRMKRGGMSPSPPSGSRRDARHRRDLLARRTLALPFHGGMTEAQVDRVVDALTWAVQTH